MRLVDEHVAELRVRVDGAVYPLEDDRLLKALAAQLGGEKDLRHAAVCDAPNDVVAAVLRHPARQTLPHLCHRFPGLVGVIAVSRSAHGFLTQVLSGMTLLSDMNNNAPSDNVVLRHAVEQIQRVLPSPWSTNVALKTNDVADARLTIKTPAGASAALAIGARRQ